MRSGKKATLGELAALVGGELSGDGERQLTGVAPLRTAGPEDVSYLESDRYRKELEESRAGAVVLGPDAKAGDGPGVIRVAQPVVAWARIVEFFHPYARRFEGVSPQAFIGEDCEIAEGVGIGPGVWVGNRVRIGRGTEIYPSATIGDDTVIGEDCRVSAGVAIYRSCTLGDRVTLHSGVVIGADGYGYTQEKVDDAAEPVRHRKIPQVGTVIIEDDVEIGANSTIDRGALEATVIGRGTKIDNLVMIAHNCRVGRHTLLVAQVGLSGSVEVGHYVTIAGQAGLAGHLKVGDRVIIGAKAGVMKDVPEGTVLLGSPALPAGLARRAYAQIEHLPEFRKTLQNLAERVRKLEEDRPPRS